MPRNLYDRILADTVAALKRFKLRGTFNHVLGQEYEVQIKDKPKKDNLRKYIRRSSRRRERSKAKV
jgi:hypothetical protein